MAAAEIGGTEAKISPEQVEEMRSRIGMILLPKQPAAYHTTTEAHFDTMRRYAFGIGDENPLWCDRTYAAGTRWKETIAFPTYTVEGYDEEPPPGAKVMPRGDPLRGLHAFVVGFDTTYYRPIYSGDRCTQISYLETVEEKTSEFGGKSIKVVRATRIKNQRGDIVKIVRVPSIHTERSTAGKREKYTTKEIDQSYSAEDIRKIDEAYATEQRRGSEKRWWEDVDIGDTMEIVKGPYTIKDWIGYCVGTGIFGAFGTGPWRLDYLNRQRIPKFYLSGSDGIPRSAFACHYDKEVANAAGVPLPYDLGAMREAFLTQMLCNWMGDDGFIFKTAIEFRKFNYLGDTQWCRGIVTDKRYDGDLCLVDIALSCTNQRGEVTTPGTATVLLPSREHGAVTLPYAPRDHF